MKSLRGLGIPLEPRNWFWVKTAAIVLILAAVLAWLEPGFGLPYLVTAVLVLPVLFPFLRYVGALGDFGQFGLFAALFAYFALVKFVVAPIIISALGYAT